LFVLLQQHFVFISDLFFVSIDSSSQPVECDSIEEEEATKQNQFFKK